MRDESKLTAQVSMAERRYNLDKEFEGLVSALIPEKPSISPEDFYVAWISAIDIEYVAAREFLDERYESSPRTSDYTLGRIGEHNVVISIGEYGTSSAAHVAEQMIKDYPNIRVALIVGIGGGAPSLKHDIRLGDIIVNVPSVGEGGLFQYDYNKTIQSKDFQITDRNKPPLLLRGAVAGLKDDYELDGHQLNEAINKILENKPRLRNRFQQPDPRSDRLYRSDFIHTEKEEPCDPLCGDDSQLISRRPREEYEDNPAIHYGIIASANQLMKDATLRDKLSAEKDILCFEMKAAGLMTHFPCIVIRGICDYSDTHKNDNWQGYAAMAAAAYAKDLLNRIAPHSVASQKTVTNVVNTVYSGGNLSNPLLVNNSGFSGFQSIRHSGQNIGKPFDKYGAPNSQPAQ